MKRPPFLTILFLCSIYASSTIAQDPRQQESLMLQMVAPDQESEPQSKPATLSGELPSDAIQPGNPASNRGSSNGSGGSFSPTAVPINNNCANAISLTVNAPCVNGTNRESGMQSGEPTSCQGSITKSVWYSFVATATSHFVEIERTAGSGCYLSSAVYSGGCMPSTSLSCEDAAGGPIVNIHNLTGLTIGNTYLIQVAYTGGGPCGNNGNASTGADFCIQVGTPVVCASCNSTCGALCIYPTQPTVAQVTSTCPPQVLKSKLNSGQTRTQCYTFTAVAASFSLQMIINATGCPMTGNVSSFNWQLYPSNCSSVIQSGNLSSMNATGLTIGASYVLCYTWTAICQHNAVYPYIVATSPLPVELLRFDARQSERTVSLSWSTASETGNQHFSVQRSADGIQFAEIGKVKGGGNSSQVLEYTFIDKKPARGINYYKLVQYDYDGSTTSSDIIALRFNDSFLATIESNPVSDLMQIHIEAASVTTISYTIIDNLGKTVIWDIKPCAKGWNEISIPVHHLTKGVYFLKLENKNGAQWTKFLKN